MAGSTATGNRRAMAAVDVSVAPPAPKARPSSRITLTLLGVGLVAVIAVVAGIALAGRQPGVAALPPASQTSLPAATNTSPASSPTSSLGTKTSVAALLIPSATLQPASATPTNTEIPTDTPTSPPALPNIGGAHKIAYINASDIWVANLDGTDIRQLTTDGAIKISLSWTPEGDALTCISTHDILTVEMLGKPGKLNRHSRADRSRRASISWELVALA